MNNRAGMNDFIYSNSLYLIVAVIFFSGMVYFVFSNYQGAAFLEDFYAKEISRVIDYAQPGDEIVLDIQKPSEVGFENKVSSFSEMFQVSNSKNEVCVKLSNSGGSCYYFFNNVEILNWTIVLGRPSNFLSFRIGFPNDLEVKSPMGGDKNDA